MAVLSSHMTTSGYNGEFSIEGYTKYKLDYQNKEVTYDANLKTIDAE